MSNLVFIVIPSVFILTLTLNLTLAERQFWFPRANETLDDVLFPNNVLFDGEVRSNLECVTSCVQTSGCFFWTFYGGNRCRGHSVAETSPAAGTPTPGARTYIADEWRNIPCVEASECPTRVDNVQCYQGQCECAPAYLYSPSNRTCVEDYWLEEACTVNSDCPTNINNVQCYQGQCKCAPGYLYSPANRTCEDTWLDEACTTDSDCPANINNVQCFSGKCNCVPGYYYSVSTHLCIPACPGSDLQTGFTFYPLYRMIGNNIVDGAPAATQSACWTMCLNYYTNNGVHCRVAEFYFTSSKCNLQTLTALDVPSSWDPDPFHKTMQRKCA